MKFRAFRRKKDNLYYFQFLSDENKVQLNSPSYADKELCFNGIRQAISSSAQIKNYSKRTDDKNNHFFILTTSKGQEIGRSIKYKTEKEIDSAITQFLAEAPKAATKDAKSTTQPEPPEATKPVKDKKGRSYLSQNQPYLCSTLTYDTFQSESNQKFYFVFKDKDENAVLINADVRGFATIEDLQNGVKAVMEFAPKKKNLEKRVAKNGKHYFLLKNDEGKSVAKSSHFYSLKKELNAAVRLVQCAGAEITLPKQQLFSDNYLPIAAYAGAEGFHTFMDEKSGEHYFAFNNSEGKTFLRSEGYKTAKSRDNGIQSVIKNGPNEKSWKTFFENNLHYYTLKAGNHQEIARSNYYDDEASMLEDFNLVKGESSPIGIGSAMVGGALMSALMIAKQKEEKAAKRKAKKEAKQKEEENQRMEEAKRKEEAKLAALAAASLKTEQEAKRVEEERRKLEEAEAAAKSADEEERKKKAAEEAAAAAALALAANQQPSATSKSSSRGGLLGWLLPLIIAILLIIAALMYFRGCEGCGKPTPVVDPDPIDTIVEDTKPQVPYGKGGEELGFIPGSMEFLMADHLSAFGSTFPRTFTAENITFSKNRIRLNTKARNQLDNLAVLLKEYPNATIEIYGYVADGEKTFYKGNKEVSLDDARANSVFVHLKKDGIEESRMEFYGNGLDDKPGVKIKLISRGAAE
jgi:uncharacterized protein YegP (UPF0339 family)/outer membrane protein OmpA-like peptidoglycan-associated protein